MSPAKTNIKPKPARDQEVAYIEADILTNIRLAAQFAELAEGHSALFDDTGFRYCVDQFLSHARSVSTHLKTLRGLDAK